MPGQCTARHKSPTKPTSQAGTALPRAVNSLAPHCEQISGTVCLFSYPLRTALAVGLSMAQIGEFAFVLLSAASQLGMLPYQVYMLLMGALLWPSHTLLSIMMQLLCRCKPGLKGPHTSCQVYVCS